MEHLSRLNIILLHISLLIVGIAINGGSAQQCGPPTLVSATPQYNATASSDPLVMNCLGASLPAIYKWEFNGDIVPSAIEFRYVVQSVMEGGVYRCGYDNINCPGGTIWSTGSIAVITQPVISISTGPVSVTQGDAVTVHCNVTSGYPTPSITWYNGSGDSLGHVSPLTVTAGSNDTLTCIATNTAGYTAGSIAITVTVVPQTSSSIQSSTVAATSSSSSIPPSTTVVSSSSIATSISSSILDQTSSTIVPTTSTSLYHSPSFSSSSLTTSVPSIATSVPTPTSTVAENSGGLTSENIFGLIITIIFLIFLLASLSFFFAVGVYWCKIARSNKKIRKEKKKREDARKLLKEDIDGEDEEKMAAVAGGVPPSTSYINEGFKEERNKGEKEEEDESDDGSSLMDVAIIPRVTIEGQQEVSTTEHYVIKMEKKTKEEILTSVVTETAEAGQASNDDVQVSPVEVIAVVEEGAEDTEEEEEEDTPSAAERDEPIARKPFLEPQDLQELVRNFESFHLEENAKESIIGKEYQAIPMLLQDMSIWPPDTYSKNRYRNVIPNKDTAVMLSGDSIADQYINANYINGYNGMEKAYICAQAPIYDTIPDFWRMIWECNVNTVVMLCGIFEGGKNKCAKYWPPPDTNDTEYYGPFTVRNNYEELLPFYKVVYLSLSINSEEAERDVMLFIFQGWPDFGVPEQAGPILEFQEAVTINHTGGPLLVHCSAGVGRSGTYIAADIGIKQYNAEKTVDPYGTVVKLKNQRGGMIQSFDQYAFLHIVLANYISKNP